MLRAEAEFIGEDSPWQVKAVLVLCQCVCCIIRKHDSGAYKHKQFGSVSTCELSADDNNNKFAQRKAHRGENEVD